MTAPCRTAQPDFADDPAMELVVDDRPCDPPDSAPFLVRVPCGWCDTTGRVPNYSNVYRDAWNRCVRCAGMGYVTVEEETDHA
jgi:hypothetical protein